jgi:hypothetical protein
MEPLDLATLLPRVLALDPAVPGTGRLALELLSALTGVPMTMQAVEPLNLRILRGHQNQRGGRPKRAQPTGLDEQHTGEADGAAPRPERTMP